MGDASESDSHTIDGFHRGAFQLVQPRRGHRAGMDAMILASAVPAGFSGTLVDLGAGAGGAGLAVAARCPQAVVTLVEKDAEMAACARRGLDLPVNAHLAGRVSVLEADASLAGSARGAAGLGERSCDFAIMNPPFNAPQDRASADARKRLAHVMEDGLLEAWLRSAASMLKPRGEVAVIARPVSLPALLDALAGRFGDIRTVPVHPRAELAAIRIVVRGRRGARGGLSIHPPLVLHGEDGAFLPRADALINGRASLFAD